MSTRYFVEVFAAFYNLSGVGSDIYGGDYPLSKVSKVISACLIVFEYFIKINICNM